MVPGQAHLGRRRRVDAVVHRGAVFRFPSPPDDDELYDLLDLGLSLYAGGAPFEAHEAWEYAWGGEVGRTKLTLQALIQIAAALHKHDTGVPRGTCKLLAKAAAKIEEIRTGCDAWLGVDLSRLAEDVRQALEQADAVALGQGNSVVPPMLPSCSGPDGFVYLHGFASSPQSNKARIIAHALRDLGFHVAIPDLNEGGFEGLTIQRAIDQVRRHIRDRTVIIGSSLGGYIGSLVAARDDRVKAMVLMAPAFDFKANLDTRHAADLDGWRERGVTEVEHYGTGRPERLAYGFYEDAGRHPAYPKPRVPTHVIHGRHDDTVPCERSAQWAEDHPRHVALELMDDDHALAASAELALRRAQEIAEKLGLRKRRTPVPFDQAMERVRSDPRFD